MAESYRNVIILLLLSCCCFFVSVASYPVAPSGYDGVRKLVSCLTSAGVDNYTVPTANPLISDTSLYYLFLNFSIQNLRFAPAARSRAAGRYRPPRESHAPAEHRPVLPGRLLRCAYPQRRAQLRGVVLLRGFRSRSAVCGRRPHEAEPGPCRAGVADRVGRVGSDPGRDVPRHRGVERLAGLLRWVVPHRRQRWPHSRWRVRVAVEEVRTGGRQRGRRGPDRRGRPGHGPRVDGGGRLLGDPRRWRRRVGAVYAWRIQLLPVPTRVTGFIVNRPGSTRLVAELVHKWQLVAPSLPDEFYLSAFVGAGLPELDHVEMSATFKGFYLGPKSEAVSIMARSFPELQLVDTDCHETSWIKSVLYFSGLPNGSTVSDLKDRILRGKKSFKAKSDYVRIPISKSNLTRAFDLLSQEPKAYLIMDPYGGAMARIRSDHIPFPHRSGNLYAIQYMIEWTAEEEASSKEHLQWIRGYYNHMGDYVSKGPRAAYVNYLDLDLGTNRWTVGMGDLNDRTANARSWGEKYFLGNYDRLVRAKTAVDPYDVFNNAQSVPPNSSEHKDMISRNSATEEYIS
ncbi:unnamed protein product [Musa textilis]